MLQIVDADVFEARNRPGAESGQLCIGKGLRRPDAGIARDGSKSFLHGLEETQSDIWNLPFDQVVVELTQDIFSGRRADEPFHLRFFRVFRSSILRRASDRRSFQN